MRIVADENIPLVVEAFSALGEVQTLTGRKMRRNLIRDAEILLVRSVTRVNQELLDESRVRFVGTATIGTDHLDLDYLTARNITVASAPGSNANSVAEYLIAALLVLSRRQNFILAGKSIGVVGVGNVGGKVVKYAEALGMKVLQNDPPLQRKTGEKRFLPLADLFSADILTLHVPLSPEGEDKTYHLADESFFARMKPGSIFINTSRGAVAEEKALFSALAQGKISAAVLDVWENEPAIDAGLAAKTALATPHIAGYSFDGKVNGTRMLYQAACEFAGTRPTWNPVLPEPPCQRMELDAANRTDEEVLRKAVLKVYAIERDDKALRETLPLPPERRRPHFDGLRKNYPVRREFFNTEIVLKNGRESLRGKLEALGFLILRNTIYEIRPTTDE